jgi:hypothetical protein
MEKFSTRKRFRAIFNKRLFCRMNFLHKFNIRSISIRTKLNF